MLLRSLSFLVMILCISSCKLTLTYGDDLDMPLEATFKIKDSFSQESSVFLVGDEVHLQIQVENRSNSSVTYEYTRPGYDFTLFKGEEVIWSAFHGEFFPQVMTSGVIGANSTITFEAVWRGETNSGDPVAIGQYEVEPYILLFVDDHKIDIPGAKLLTLN